MDGRRSRTRVVAVLALATLALTLAGCQQARVGARCRRNTFAQSGDWVLSCPGGRWARWKPTSEVTAWFLSLPRPAPPPPISDGVAIQEIQLSNGVRPLPTRVYLPPAATPSPWPLIVFASGYNSTPGTYETLLRGWAAAGFEVAAPRSPGLSSDLPGVSEANLPQQPGDLSATITQMLADPTIDPNRVALAGHSDGGSAVASVALTPEHADARVRAFIVVAGAAAGIPGGWGPNNAAPMLVIVGDHDEYGNGRGATRRVYDLANGPKAFVYVIGGTHLGPLIEGTPLAVSTRASTLDFLRATLGGGDFTALRSDASSNGLQLSTVGVP